ncbi:c2H2-type domain-containing protein [Caerostris extrusa]|uniref:C2H2-type domain-containing protein n=1 Tax=Caerostris extrusa TaxID=172846 RepID=A0AAV4RZB7_CAEEX|nr:c2H2-type domain-containing protein [Caerostris extrusa]
MDCVFVSDKNKSSHSELSKEKFVNDEKSCIQDKLKDMNVDTGNKTLISEKVIELVENSSICGNVTKSTSSSGFNRLLGESLSVSNNTINSSDEKVICNHRVDKTKKLNSPLVNNEANDHHNNFADKSAIEIQGNLNENYSKEAHKNCNLDAQNKDLNRSISMKDGKNNNLDNMKEPNICVNGYRETEVSDDKNYRNRNGNQKAEKGKIEKEHFSHKTFIESCGASNNIDEKVSVSNEVLKKNNFQSENPARTIPQILKEMNKTNLDANDNEPIMTRRSHFLKNGYSLTFSHPVLDAKLPGISTDMISDFVIVLESLRNRQLKSSYKWSQIKHMCEHYMDVVSNIRSNMLNTHPNSSIDSEADSTSELTANEFKDFEFHQSDDSTVEDRFVDKSRIFKRFMNTDDATGMATYVTLSDIHCPQISLDKLFCTDHSSSHIGHKKKHKKHRNHEKSPGKLALKKIRHGSRAQRELAKRKKKKKRKAKRGKGHTKKHHFTHGKVTKEYVKNKKKKHKLKKKKEGNSGFISGDYCSDFSSGELMRLVKEHSNSYSKIPASTSKHPHSTALVVRSASSSDGSDEPPRKKRKVSFVKKRNRDDKCRDKHKHVKSKSGKRKKTIVVESCNTDLKNVIGENEMESNLDSVNDYSRIVQFSSVKKMEAVQIRQRSVALNLSKVGNKSENKLPSTNPCQTKPQQFSETPLQQFVQHNFEGYSPEDIMKMQLLMARQQPDVSAITTTVSSTNNQAVVKYVCSKTTSRLLSVAQTTNCTVGSDSETSKSPVPIFSSRTSTSQKMPTVQPQNLSTNMKHLVIEACNKPYKIASSSAVTGGALIPANLAGSTYTDVHNLTGTMLSGNVSYPCTSTSPQVTTFTFPVSPNQLGGKFIGNKIVIPLPSCGHLKTSSSGMALIPSESSTNTISGNQSASNIIIVKNGNNTQIIQAPQQPCSSRPCITSTKVKNINPIISKTVPKILRQATKKLTVKKTVTKSPTITNTICKEPTDLSVVKLLNPDLNSSKLSTMPDAIPKETLTSVNSEPTPESLLVQRAIAEAKRAIAESKPDPKKSSKPKLEVVEEKEEKINPLTQPNSKDATEDPAENEEHSISLVDSLKSDDSNSIKREVENTISDITVSLETEAKNEEKVILSKSISESDKHDLLENIKEDASNIDIQDDNLADIPVSPQKKDATVELDVVPEQNSLPDSGTVSSETVVDETSPTDASSHEISKRSISEEKVSPTDEKNLSCEVTDTEVPEKLSSEPEINVCSTTPVSPTSNDQQKELLPINTTNTPSNVKTSEDKTVNLAKAENRSSVPEGATRSFTSISDAVRFSLMDMDDANDSVENQVLQAFQVTHESSANSPAYDNNSTNEGEAGENSSSVILTTPQNATTTELNVSRVSQRFETSVHGSETEKFTECQSTVSRTTTWILEDSSLNESSQVMQIQKSPDIDSSGEGKDEDKPKKKRKRKDRCDRDLEATHKFWCEICHKGFFSAYNLRRHCRNVHKMNLPRGSSELPFGPKNTPEISFANSSQCHQQNQQNESSSTEVVTSPHLTYVQQTCISPKGAEFMLQSPTRESKTQDFSIKSSTNQHAAQMQNTEFQIQTPPRLSNPSSSSSSTHVSPVTPPKDFRLPNASNASTQLSPTKMSPATKSNTSPKFQRLPTSCSTPTTPQLTKISQISLCGQPTLQQQRQIAQIQQSPLVQPLTTGACQAQQMQAAQCSHFQANKQMQQRIGQLQLMHHAGQMSQVQHQQHGITKQNQIQSYKKNSATQPTTKLTETEQIQQAAQLAQTQQIITNQHLQKLMHIRQNAIAASGAASQLSLGASLPGIQGSQSKSTSQCFQSQLAVARQAAAVTQLPTPQRNQGAGYALSSHDSPLHQFFPPSAQAGQEQPSCPHSFTAQNVVEFNASGGPSYPAIRLSSETNDGLEDLEQFLLENMPWSGEQSVSHALNQQSGNRPSSADSLTLAIPSQSSISVQNRTGAQLKNKTSITRPKPRKPIVAPCSKNLLGNVGRGVKKKSCPKKVVKNVDSDCMGSKLDVFSQNNLMNQHTHGLNLMQRQCNKSISNDLYPSKSSKGTTISSINETDSSDSVQCINVTHNPNSKNPSVGINFNTFSSDKNMNSLCNADQNPRLMFGLQSKNSFLDHCNLVNKSCSNLGDKSSNICEPGSLHAGSPFAIPSKESMCDPKTVFYGNAGSSMCSKRPETEQDIFLGQRNNEKCDSHVSRQGNSPFSVQDSSSNYNQKLKICEISATSESEKINSVSEMQNNLFLGEKTASINSAVSVKIDNVSNVESENSSSKINSDENSSSMKKNFILDATETSTQMEDKEQSSANKSETLGDTSMCIENNLESENFKINEQTKEINSINKYDVQSENDKIIKSVKIQLSKEQDASLINVVSDSKSDSSSHLSESKVSDSSENCTISDVQRIITGELILKDVSSENSIKNNHVDKNIVSEETIITAKESSSDSPVTFCVQNTAVDDSSKSELTENCDNKSSTSNNDDLDKQSCQENKIPNGLKHTSDMNFDCENEKEEPVSRRIALRIHKSQENFNRTNQDQYYINEKSFNDVKAVKRNSHKKKNSKKCKVTNEKTPHKLDINSNIQEADFVNIKHKQNSDMNVQEEMNNNINGQREMNGDVNEQKEVNGDVSKQKDVNGDMNDQKEMDGKDCIMPDCCQENEDDHLNSEETQENDIICSSYKQKHQISEETPPSRLRLRDTPKTSVKRVCPCCSDSKMPKKCRANGNSGGILKVFTPKVLNANKAKTTVKTKNNPNTPTSKVNTRSSQRLRSRNNAIS